MENAKKQLKLLKMALAGMVGLLALSCDPEMSDAPAPADAGLATAERSHDKKGMESPAAQNKINAEIRRATAHYHQVERAVADGYAPVSHCVPGMGVHYLNMGYLSDGVVDPSRPELLVYEPMKNGRLKLVAVEFMVIAGPWDAAHDGPPMLGSQAFDDHRPVGSPGPPFPHYQLHAWVWKNNPAGMYTPFNPTVSCEF